MVPCVKLVVLTQYMNMTVTVLLFDYLVYRQNVTCAKRFTRYGHYAGEVEDIIIGRLAVVPCFKFLCHKLREFSCGLITLR